MKPGDHELRSMAILNNDPNYACIMKWFTRSLNELDKQNRITCGDALIQGQGAAQLLAEFIDFSDKAKDYLKMKSDHLTKHQSK